MVITGELVLPADVRVVAVADLEPAWRDRLDCGPGDYTVTRRGTRSTSNVVDRLTARLLEHFRSPQTIVDAIIEFSRAEELDPRQTLEDVFGLIRMFIEDGVLVVADSEFAHPITATLAIGGSAGDFEIVEAIHVIVDTEVYRARPAAGQEVALKIARPGSEQRMAVVFAHEAAVLGRLAGPGHAGLAASGSYQDRPYLAVSWCAGADVMEAAAELRAIGGQDALLDLVERVLVAFDQLHRQSVLHGDVHPRNVLVDVHGAVKLIDFGLAAAPGLPALAPAGADLFTAPEIAAAYLDGRRPPALDPLSEQYAVAALAYLLLTGSHTHVFSLERDEMLRQVRDEPPAAFGRAGVSRLGPVEQTLGRALAKSPAGRYRSVGELLAAFRAAKTSALQPPRTDPRPGFPLADGVLKRLAVPGELFPGPRPAPTASVMNGAAGFAYALLRMAAIRDDEHLLALADLWSMAAVRSVGHGDAFYSKELELTPETVGARSFQHHEPGVRCVQVLVAGARADDLTQRHAMDEFVRAAHGPCPELDVSFGRAGLLIACAQILEALSPEIDSTGITSLGDQLTASIEAELTGEPAIAESGHGSLGAAHGWAGYLYALLRWSVAAGRPSPSSVPARLDQLMALGQARGRARYWPAAARTPLAAGPLAASWCNGAAGYVPLWTLAHAVYQDDRYEQLAAAAAWGAYEGAYDGRAAVPGDICCGLAGRAFSLATQYTHTGDQVWLARARLLADRAAERILDHPYRRDSLYKGDIGVALLADELTAAAPAGLPLFASEGWPRLST